MIDTAGSTEPPDKTSPPALSLERVTKQYGDRAALDGVDLGVPPGALAALVGESGAGKTTLLHCFNRMVVPDAGTVRIGGQDVGGMAPHLLRRRVGYVPQHGGLLPHWDVLQNVGLVPRLQEAPDAEERARRSLERVGLPPGEFGPRWPRSLSGGQRQRVALARALAADQKVLLLDEPFGALDAITRARMQASFAAMRADLKVTAVLVTHDLREAFLLADQVAVLHAGHVLRTDTPEGIEKDPGHPYVAELLRQAGVVRCAAEHS